MSGKVLEGIRHSLTETLQLGGRGAALRPDTRLLGELAELDSMAVLHVIMDLEERFGFVAHDDEISADIFQSVGSLADFVKKKLTG